MCYTSVPATIKLSIWSDEVNVGDAVKLRSVGTFINSRFVRFVVVGGVNTVACYSAYALALYVGLSYPIANVFALFVGIALGFKMQGTIVFGNPDNRLFFRFVAFWGIMYF